MTIWLTTLPGGKNTTGDYLLTGMNDHPRGPSMVMDPPQGLAACVVHLRQPEKACLA